MEGGAARAAPPWPPQPPMGPPPRAWPPDHGFEAAQAAAAEGGQAAAGVTGVLRPWSVTGACQGEFTGPGMRETVVVRGPAGMELLRSRPGGGRWASVGWASIPAPVVHVATVPRQGRGDASDGVLWLDGAGRLRFGAWAASEGPEAGWTLVELASAGPALDDAVDPDAFHRRGPGGLGLVVDPTATWVALLARAGAAWVMSVDFRPPGGADGAPASPGGFVTGVWRIAWPSGVPTVWAGTFARAPQGSRLGRLVLGVELEGGTPAALCVDFPAPRGARGDLEPVAVEVGRAEPFRAAAALQGASRGRRDAQVIPVHAVYPCAREGAAVCVTDEGIFMVAFEGGDEGSAPCVAQGVVVGATVCAHHPEEITSGMGATIERSELPFVTCCAQVTAVSENSAWPGKGGRVLVQYDSGMLVLAGWDDGREDLIWDSHVVGTAPVGYFLVQISAEMLEGEATFLLCRDMADSLELRVTRSTDGSSSGASSSARAVEVDRSSRLLWNASPGADVAVIPVCNGKPDAIVVCGGLGAEGALTVVRNEIGCEGLSRHAGIVRDQGLCGMFSFESPGQRCWRMVFCFPLVTRVMQFNANGRLEDVTEWSGFTDDEETICAGILQWAGGPQSFHPRDVVMLAVQVTPRRVCCLGDKAEEDGQGSVVNTHWQPSGEGGSIADTIVVAAIGSEHIGVLLKSSRLLVLLGPTGVEENGGSVSIHLREQSPSLRIEEEVSCMALLNAGGRPDVLAPWKRTVALGTFSEKVLIAHMDEHASRVMLVLDLRYSLGQTLSARAAIKLRAVASMPLVVESAVVGITRHTKGEPYSESMELVLGLRSGTLMLVRVHLQLDLASGGHNSVERHAIAQADSGFSLAVDLASSSIEQLGDAPLNIVPAGSGACGTRSFLVSGGGLWYCTLGGGFEVLPIGVSDTGVGRAVSFSSQMFPLGVAVLSADALTLLSLECRDGSFDATWAPAEGPLSYIEAHPVYPSVRRLALNATPRWICGLQDSFPGHALVCCTSVGVAPSMAVADLRRDAGRIVSVTMLCIGDQVMALATAGPHVAIALHGGIYVGRILTPEGGGSPKLQIESSCSLTGPVPGVAFMAEEAAGVLSPRAASGQKRQRRMLAICGENIVCLVLVLDGEAGEAELLTAVKTHDLGCGMLTCLHLCPGGLPRFAVGTSAYGALVLDLELLPTRWSDDEPSLVLTKFHLAGRTSDDIDYISSVADVHMLDGRHLAVMRRSGHFSVYAFMGSEDRDRSQESLVEILSHEFGTACLRLRKAKVARETAFAGGPTLLVVSVAGGLDAISCLPRDASVACAERLLGEVASSSKHNPLVRALCRIDSLIMLARLPPSGNGDADADAATTAQQRDFIRRFARRVF